MWLWVIERKIGKKWVPLLARHSYETRKAARSAKRKRFDNNPDGISSRVVKWERKASEKNPFNSHFWLGPSSFTF